MPEAIFGTGYAVNGVEKVTATVVVYGVPEQVIKGLPGGLPGATHNLVPVRVVTP